MSGIPAPPSNLLPFFQEASQGTGLPISVVEAQNFVESDYGKNMGPSSAGAEGPWQFLPSTYAGTGQPAGTEFQWGPSTKAYVTYMSQLLKQEGGSVFKALEAYNAGPGNLSAGAGYASNILSLAGQPQSATASGGTGNVSTASIHIPGTNIDIPTGPGDLLKGLFGGAFQGVFSGLLKDIRAILVRLGLILMGGIIIVIGFYVLTKAHGNSTDNMKQSMEEIFAKEQEARNTGAGTVASESNATEAETMAAALWQIPNSSIPLALA